MKTASRNLITTLLVISLIVPLSVGFFALPTVHAQEEDEIGSEEYGIGSGTVASAGGVLSCLGGSVPIGAGVAAAAAAAGLVVPVLDNPNLTVNTTHLSKECVLDGLTTVIREVLIASITRSIVNWINNGFEGEPAFVTDLEGFLLDVADQVIGTYIEGSELADLCSPFQIDVRIALALDYYSPFRDRAACTLTGVLQNISDAFGDFSTGQAWDAWFELSVNPYNNALGSYLGSRNALRTSIAQAQSEQLRILDWGRGIRSYEVCDTEGVEDPRNSANVSIGQYNCRIATPGVVINENLNQVIGSGFRQLELADEINEIVGALLGQLAKQVFTSGTGLSGLSRSSFGRPSYLDQLTQSSETNAQGEFRDFGVSVAEGFISTEQLYTNQKTVSLERLNTSESLLRSLEQCYAGKLSPLQNPSLTFEERNIARERMNTATSTIAASITPLKTLIQSDIAQAEDNISRLLIIKNNLLEASSRVSVERIIATELDPLVETRTVHSQPDFVIAEQQKEDLQDITDSMNQSTNANLEICRNFPIQQNQQ